MKKISNNLLKFIRVFLPIKTQIKLEMRIKCKRKMNFKNPERFTEKIQLYKLNYHSDLLTKCADKYEVRDFVAKRGLGHILNEVYGVYDKPEQIKFNELPEKFVIKLNFGSGFNIFVDNKATIDEKTIIKQLKKWLKYPSSFFGSEWAYKNIKRKIIIEKYLPFNENEDLPDYKFFCFDGETDYLYVMTNYVKNHSQGVLNFYDTNFNLTKYGRKDYAISSIPMPKPQNFEKMIEYARILSAGFPHARVDFYNIDGQIVFGEITFYTNGGFINFKPDDFDYILGEKFDIK